MEILRKSYIDRITNYRNIFTKKIKKKSSKIYVFYVKPDILRI